MSIPQFILDLALENPTKLNFVYEAHEKQTDKQGKDYFFDHLVPVAYSLPDHLKWVGLGHDLREDTGVTYAAMARAGFTSNETFLIEGLTHEKGQSLEDYIKLVRLVPEAVEVKVADIVNNLSRLGGLDKDTKQRLYSKYQKSLMLLINP